MNLSLDIRDTVFGKAILKPGLLNSRQEVTGKAYNQDVTPNCDDFLR